MRVADALGTGDVDVACVRGEQILEIMAEPRPLGLAGFATRPPKGKVVLVDDDIETVAELDALDPGLVSRVVRIGGNQRDIVEDQLRGGRSCCFSP